MSLNDYPGGVSEVDLLWNNYFTQQEHEMILYAGFFGAKQNADKSLEPYISWAIAHKNNASYAAKIKYALFVDRDHDLAYWSPKFAKNVTIKAFYNPEKFQDHETSIAFVKQTILDSLAENRSTANISKSGFTLSIEVYTTGEIGEITINGSDYQIKTLSVPIQSIIRGLPATWSPAKAKVKEVLRLMENYEDSEKIVVVNSRLQIEF